MSFLLEKSKMTKKTQQSDKNCAKSATRTIFSATFTPTLFHYSLILSHMQKSNGYFLRSRILVPDFYMWRFSEQARHGALPKPRKRHIRVKKNTRPPRSGWRR